MTDAYLLRLLEQVRSHEVEIQDALTELKRLPYQDLGYARLDHHRALRTGFPEIIYGASKTPDQIASILQVMADRHDVVLCSRASAEAFIATRALVPHATFHEIPGMIVVEEPKTERPDATPGVAVVSAGTGDLPVSEEAAITAEAMGHRVARIVDVGVAGLHRILSVLDVLTSSNVIVVAAGMEGALPSVVAGLVDVPVIALPTSVGYGASFAGLAALLAMLNSCAVGIATVNIDNGVGAGVMAAMINRQRTPARRAHLDVPDAGV